MKRLPQDYIQRLADSGRLVGRPLVLTDNHKDFLMEWTDENTDSVVLGGMLEMLTVEFRKLEIAKKNGLYKFVNEKM